MTRAEEYEVFQRAVHLAMDLPTTDDHFDKVHVVGDVTIEWSMNDARSWCVAILIDGLPVALYWHPSTESRWLNERRGPHVLETLRRAMVLEDLSTV